MSENTELENKQEETADERVIYELGYHVLPTVGDEHLAEEVQKIKETLEKHGAIFITEEFPTLLRLAYTIVRSVGGKREKYDTSYFGWMKFDLPSGEVNKFKEDFEENESILRYIIIKTVKEDTRESHRPVVLKSSEEKITKEKQIKEVEKGESDAKDAVVSEEELDRTIKELVVE